MRSVKWTALAAVLIVLLASGATFAQPQAPQPPVELIMGVKTTEPVTVLEKTFTANPREIGRVLRPIADEVFAAVAEAGINVLPNHATVVILASMQEMMQGLGDEMKGTFRVPVIDDLEPGELPGHPDIKVVRVEAQLVGYTYGKGTAESVAQERFPSLAMWLMGQGHVPTGPFYLSIFQNPGQTAPLDTVCEVQVGLKKPEQPPGPQP